MLRFSPKILPVQQFPPLAKHCAPTSEMYITGSKPSEEKVFSKSVATNKSYQVRCRLAGACKWRVSKGRRTRASSCLIHTTTNISLILADGTPTESLENCVAWTLLR